jgi:flagellar secretion chaperone FliS
MDARSSYRETAVRGASPVRLVVCLYEQAISDLRRAAVALEQGDIERRTRDINHALLVIGQLQGTLDIGRGGTVARNLAKFYNLLRAGLVEAQAKQSRQILEQQIAVLALVHEAWQQVERDTSTSATTKPALSALAPSASETPVGDWNA